MVHNSYFLLQLCQSSVNLYWIIWLIWKKHQISLSQRKPFLQKQMQLMMFCSMFGYSQRKPRFDIMTFEFDNNLILFLPIEVTFLSSLFCPFICTCLFQDYQLTQLFSISKQLRFLSPFHSSSLPFCGQPIQCTFPPYFSYPHPSPFYFVVDLFAIGKKRIIFL